MPLAATTQRAVQGAFEANQRPYRSAHDNQQRLQRMAEGQMNKVPKISTATAMLYTAMLMNAVASVPYRELERGAKQAAETAISNNKAMLRDAIRQVAVQAARNSAVSVMERLAADAFNVHGRVLVNRTQPVQQRSLHVRARLPAHTIKKGAQHRSTKLPPLLAAGSTQAQANTTLSTPSARH